MHRVRKDIRADLLTRAGRAYLPRARGAQAPSSYFSSSFSAPSAAPSPPPRHPFPGGADSRRNLRRQCTRHIAKSSRITAAQLFCVKTHSEYSERNIHYFSTNAMRGHQCNSNMDEMMWIHCWVWYEWNHWDGIMDYQFEAIEKYGSLIRIDSFSTRPEKMVTY